MKIKGKVVYQDLGLGFWGIEDNKGNQWRPVKMPEQLKHVGKEVQVTAREVDEDMSMFMWGTAIEITAFETLGP
jgi:hypothetical protein